MIPELQADALVPDQHLRPGATLGERRPAGHAVDHRVGHHRRRRHHVVPTPGQRQPQDELAAHAQARDHRVVLVVERDLLDRLGEPPDHPPGLTREPLVHRQPVDVGPRLTEPTPRHHEERDPDLEIIPEIVVPIVDDSYDELAPPRRRLDDLERVRHHPLRRVEIDLEQSCPGRRVPHDAPPTTPAHLTTPHPTPHTPPPAVVDAIPSPLPRTAAKQRHATQTTPKPRFRRPHPSGYPVLPP